MKKVVFGALFLALMGTTLTFTSCEKNTLFATTENDEIKSVTLKSSDNQSITMLEFKTTEEYDKTIELLEEEMERLDDIFVKTYSDLNDEELNEKEDEIGYNDRQVLIDFVESKHFKNSMLYAFLDAEEQWLNNEFLDERTAPSNIYTVAEAEMALLNKNGEVKIADQIIKITSEGIVEFKSANIDNIIAFNKGNLDVLNNENVHAYFNTNQQRSSSDCSWWKGQNEPHKYAWNKKVIRHIHFHKYPWKSTSLTKIKSYKKKYGRWRLYRTRIGVDNQSYFKHKDDCSTTTLAAYNSRSVKKRKKRRCRITYWVAHTKDRAKNGASVYGTFTYPGYSIQDVLSW